MKLAVNFRLIFYMCGWVLLFLAAVMLTPIIVSFVQADGTELFFLSSAAVVAFLASIMIFFGKKKTEYEVRGRDGLAIVGFAWLLIGCLGALPYCFSGIFDNYWDAAFESFSGFSATGATVIADLEIVPDSIIFWRALSHWLGGMGVIVLMLAILPFLGLSGVHLFKNESTLGQQKIKPRIAQTAKILWLIYLILSLIMLILLLLGGMDFFDALCHALSGISTGGFSVRNISIAHYKSWYIEIVMTVFMFIGSLNFAIYYQFVQGNWKAIVKNTECRVFVYIILICSVLIYLSLLSSGHYSAEPLAGLRHSFFQVVSVISTTGFNAADWVNWPSFCQSLLFLLFFVGGCSGSTSGGIKCIRIILMVKGAYRALRQQIHPRAVITVRLAGQAISENIMASVWAFAMIYISVLSLSTLALSALGIDFLSSFSASVSALSNVGLGLGELSTSTGFANLPSLAKVILSLDMILGRLEFYALMMFFLPEFWKK